jgi:hypothetical protein
MQCDGQAEVGAVFRQCGVHSDTTTPRRRLWGISVATLTVSGVTHECKHSSRTHTVDEFNAKAWDVLAGDVR